MLQKVRTHSSHYTTLIFLRFQSVPAGKCVFGVVSEQVSEVVEALACGEPDLAGAVPGVRVLS